MFFVFPLIPFFNPAKTIPAEARAITTTRYSIFITPLRKLDRYTGFRATPIPEKWSFNLKELHQRDLEKSYDASIRSDIDLIRRRNSR